VGARLCILCQPSPALSAASRSTLATRSPPASAGPSRAAPPAAPHRPSALPRLAPAGKGGAA